MNSVLMCLALLSGLLTQSGQFEPVFNGFDLTGWSGDQRYWSVEEGLLVGASTEATQLSGNTYLFLDEPAGDFELLLEFRILSGNSGVQYRSRKLADYDADGYQADLEAGPTYNGILYDVAGRGPLAQRGQRVVCDANGTTRVLETFADADTLQAAVRAGEWNRYRIAARGRRLVHEINDHLMVDVLDQHPERGVRSGLIGLQLHGGAPMRVEFRRLRLRRFESGADWIWSRAEAQENEQCVLARGFALESRPRQAELLIGCDNHYIARLNGEVVGQGDDWARPGRHDVLAALKLGENLLQVECTNDGGPGALAAQIEVTTNAGVVTALVTDPTWWCEQQGVRRLVHALGATSDPGQVWSGVFPPERTPPAQPLVVPDGFEAREVCRSESGEGSWITLTFDERGRILAAREEGGLVRITLHPDRIEKEVLELFPGAAQGLLAAHGGLYVNVSSGDAELGGLFFFRDTDGDDQYDQSERILKYSGGGEHGAHAVVLGPDDALYLMQGNMVSLPEELADSSAHRNYAEDLLLERAWDPNGHAQGTLAPGAKLLRLDRERNVELVAAGQRNPYDLAFRGDGELFTYDADMEWDLGLPWYRPTRITHLVSASEFGWRSGSGKWPSHYPDSLPPVVDIGPGSPTGVTFAEQSGFPSPWREALFVGDWSLGRILAVHLEAHGASFTGSFEEFASATPLNVTGLEFGPDGALYFVTGGRGTASSLYRVDWTGPVTGERAREPDQLARKAREIRHALERDHRREDPAAIDRAWPYLGHPDRHLRYAARIALERQPFAAWRERALAEPDPDRSLTALLAAARVGAALPLEILGSLERRPFDTLSTRQQRDELRSVAVALIRSGSSGTNEPTTRARMLRRYLPLFPTADAATDRQLFDLLLYLEAPGVISLGLSRMERDEDFAERFHVAFALRTRVTDFSPEQLGRYQAFLRQAVLVEGGVSFSGYLDLMRAALPEAEREPEVQAPDPVAASPDPANPYHHWTLEELLPRLQQVSSGRSFAGGQAAFQSALCTQCHRFGGQGGTGAAPDLTNAAGHFNRRDLLEAVIEPSKIITDQYRTTALIQRDGSLVTGQLIEDSAERVVIRLDLISDTRLELDPAEIVQRLTSPVSLMPPALLDSLRLEQILDLIAYIESRGDPKHPAFR